MKQKKVFSAALSIGLSLALLAVLYTACYVPLEHAASAGFTVTFPSGGNARAAGFFETVHTWRISGTNSGSVFSQVFPGTDANATVTDLFTGDWVITVDGLDDDETVLFTGNEKCTLLPGNNAVSLGISAVAPNVNLSALSVSAGTLSPAFDPSVVSYTLNVVNSVAAVTLAGTAMDTKAAVYSSSPMPMVLDPGSTHFIFTVVGRDGRTGKVYSVNVVRAASTITVEGPLTYGGAVVALVSGSSTIDFGYVNPARTITFTITNAGINPVRLTSTLNGGTAYYSLPSPLSSYPLAPGSSVPVGVHFAFVIPYYTTQNSELRIISDDPDTADFTLNLTGFCNS